MSNALRDTVSRLLAAEGAIIEPVEPDGLEVLAPAPLQDALAIPELARLGFGLELAGQHLHVNLESEWMNRLQALVDRRGRLLQMTWPNAAAVPAGKDLGETAGRGLALDNATFRLGEAEPARTHYLWLAFRVTALSEEKREEIIHLCLNESNLAEAEHLVEPLRAALYDRRDCDAPGPDRDDAPPPPPTEGLRNLVARALPGRLRLLVAPFVAGMERRMTRDLERLRTYHADLMRETAVKLEEKKRKGEPDETLARERLRLDAIEREYAAKVADLQRKYAMTVEAELLQACRVLVPVRRQHLTILRRKGKRDYHLDWNPVSRRLDQLPCESCYALSKSHAICDDRLHILCPECHAPCPSCGKLYCRACHPARCPTCPRQ
ncbi:MAG: hypothetical protein A3K19_11450 [Lentisphaerae bacterium RIFOXYB12_FULL_65_16]|nr:MAG: hypothetical protein A3K18_09720 [Lentisphaerae bacterium RIFOXYA12_64_32]OGV90193.1 MAG: hypothetical protein A3K19_11450 [Lentisphaerae bacterium RIFOXYB12_FULL_65_16]